MAETLLVGAIICSLVALAVSLFTLRKHQQAASRMQAQQQAWERAQEARQQQWKTQQERQAFDTERRQMEAEKQLKEQAYQLQNKWREMEQEDKARAEKLQQQFDVAIRQVRQEYELARLPLIEDMPLPAKSKEGHDKLAPNRQAADLKGANLSKRDLSSRYLSHSDLRDARLTKANLFMADLSWAHLANANLVGANLSASNLSHTDLREANMEGADFLVTDLDNTILIGANLQHARNLTAEQLQTAIYNETTRFDPTVEQALQHKPAARPSTQTLPASQEQATTTRKAEELNDQPDIEATSDNKDAWIDTPLPQAESALEKYSTSNAATSEDNPENKDAPDQPEEIAENA